MARCRNALRAFQASSSGVGEIGGDGLSAVELEDLKSEEGT